MRSTLRPQRSRASFHLRCNRMLNKDKMMHASVADVKWNAP